MRIYAQRVKIVSEREVTSWTGATLKETVWLMDDGTTETDVTVIRLNNGDDDGELRWGRGDGEW